MNKKISNLEIGVLNYFSTRAFFIGLTFNSLIRLVKQDSWIVPLLSLIVGFIFILAVNYISNYKPDFNITEKINSLFGNISSKVVLIFLFIIVFVYCIINYINLNNFIHGQFLNNTPIMIISIMFMIAMAYILYKGIVVIARTSSVLFYIGIILFIISLFMLIPSFEISNLKPFFQFSGKNLVKSINCFYALNISPMFILTIIPKKDIENPKIKKAITLSYLLSTITLFFVIFATISTFGYELTSLYEYPEFHVLKHIYFIGTSSRIESILVIQWIFDSFIYNILALYFCSVCIKNFSKKIKISLKNLGLLCCAVVLVMVNLLSRYDIYLNNFILKYAYVSISIIVSLLTIIICLKIKIGKS